MDALHNRQGKGRKGAIQVDFVIAVGSFLVIFAFLLQYITGYYAAAKDDIELAALRSEALGLLRIADQEPVPKEWTTAPLRLGLRTYAYRFYVLINNTTPYLRNPSDPLARIEGELVTFNYSDLGFPGIDINSTVIYDNDTVLPYQITDTNITFNVSVSASEEKWIVVYFDDNSNFSSRSSTVSGVNNLTEKIFAAERIPVLQYKQLQRLNTSNYTLVKNMSDIKNNFRIQLADIDINQTYISYGGAPPRRGDVISLQRFVVYQNATAAVRKGRLTVQVW